jgi:hypothetical protein
MTSGSVYKGDTGAFGAYQLAGGKLHGSVTFPITMRYSEKNTFREQKDITSVFINEGFESILPDTNTCTFYDCKKLQQISLPSTLSTLPQYSLLNCDVLSKVFINNENIMLPFTTALSPGLFGPSSDHSGRIYVPSELRNQYINDTA